MSASTRIAASATALVLAVAGLTACNDSEGDTDTTGVNPTDAVTSEDPVSGGSSGGSSAGGSSVGGSSAGGSVSDGSAGGAVSGGSSAGGSSVGGAEMTDSPLGGAEASDSPLGGAEAPEQVDPLSPQMTP